MAGGTLGPGARASFTMQADGMPSSKSFCEILGLGCAAVDDILFLPRYPEADAKVEVRERQRHCGGLTATALVAAARLGARCAFAGRLGTDEGSMPARIGTGLRRVCSVRPAFCWSIVSGSQG